MKISSTLLLFSIITFISAFFKEKPLDKYFEVNLIKNSGAEEKIVGQKIPYWTPTPETPGSGTMHGTYGEKEGGWEKGCNENCGLPPNPGKSYFRLPLDKNNSQISLSQEVDLSPTVDINNERKITSKTLSYVAGTFCENKKCFTANIVESFYDKDGNRLSGIFSTNADNAFFEFIEAKDGKKFKFKRFNSIGLLPKGTSKLIIKLEGRKADCCDNATVFFDNLSYVLSKGELR